MQTVLHGLDQTSGLSMSRCSFGDKQWDWRAMVAVLVLSLVTSPSVSVAQSVQRWALQSELRLNEEYQGPSAAFTLVSRLAVDGSGSVYVVDGRIQEIRVFDNAGKYLRTIGRSGRGPGEFRGVSSAGFLGDTLWTLDSGLRRLTLFDRDGEVLATRSVQVPSFNAGSMRLNAFPEALINRRVALATASPADFMQAASPNQGKVPLLRMTPEGEITDTLTWLEPQHERFYIPNSAGGALFGRQKFVRGPLTLFSPSLTTPVIVVDRRDAQSADRSSYSVVGLNLEGDTAWTTRIAYEPRRSDRAIVDSVLRSAMRSAMRSGLSPDQAEKALYLPEFQPPVTGGFVGADGLIWLRREDDRPNVDYQILDKNGNYIAQLAVPSNVTLRAARNNNVWGVELDEDGVPTVVRYAITAGR